MVSFIYLIEAFFTQVVKEVSNKRKCWKNFVPYLKTPEIKLFHLINFQLNKQANYISQKKNNLHHKLRIINPQHIKIGARKNFKKVIKNNKTQRIFKLVNFSVFHRNIPKTKIYTFDFFDKILIKIFLFLNKILISYL